MTRRFVRVLTPAGFVLGWLGCNQILGNSDYTNALAGAGGGGHTASSSSTSTTGMGSSSSSVGVGTSESASSTSSGNNGSSVSTSAGSGGAGGGCGSCGFGCCMGSCAPAAPKPINCSTAPSGTCPPTTYCETNGCADWPSWMMPEPAAAQRNPIAAYDLSIPGVVKDTITELWWKLDLGSAGSLAAAEAWCSGRGGGPDCDWRVPTATELISIIDYTVAGPALSADFTTSLSWPLDAAYWTVSDCAGSSGSSWVVDLKYGTLTSCSGAGSYNVVCVRGGTPAANASQRFVAVDGGVYDTVTQLTWDDPPVNDPSEPNAVSGCDKSSPKMLPSPKQLETIVDRTLMMPALDPAFSNGSAGNNPYWAYVKSPAFPGDAGETPLWTVSFQNGAMNVATYTTTAGGSSRCVIDPP